MMHHSFHHPIFTVLALAIAVLGSWTALDLFRRVEASFGRARFGWMATAALAMGTSIWSMHFVAMLGFDPGSAVSYDPLLTVASLLLAIGATGGAFLAAAPEGVRLSRIVVAGAAMGAGICAMHYVGMAAVRSSVSLGHDLRFVSLSLVVAVVASTAALLVVRRSPSTALQGVASVILGLAVVGMHYTAMAALKLAPIAGSVPIPASSPPYALAFAVSAATTFVLFLALMASLVDQRANILAALDAGGVGYWELDLRTHTLHLSPKGKAVFGLLPDQSLTYAQALEHIAPESRAQREAKLAEAVRSGTDYDVEYAFAAEGRWVNARGRVLRSRSGRSSRMVGVVIDVTERRNALAEIFESEKRQRVLINELNHRVKNTLATVQSIARHTAKRADGPVEFHRDFEARLSALSSTHNALTRGGWEQASLRELVAQELRAYPADQVSVAGEEIALSVRQTLALGMVLHELATNAVKHGALSDGEGRIEIAWTVEQGAGNGTLVFRWTETGRPIATAPTRIGFGSRLIRSSIEGELDGEATINFDPDGLKCLLIVPLVQANNLGSAAE